MSRKTQTDGSDEQRRIHRALASRREFLEAAGAAGVLAGVGGVAVGQDGAETTYEFGGEVSGWQGRTPSEIEGERNPTLELEAGTEYEVVWENVDGQPHDFVIQDENGDELEGTQISDEQGEELSFTFTASEEMDQYICTVHPTSMVGDIQVGDQAEGEQQEGDQFGGYVPEGPTVGVEQVAAGPLVNPINLRSVPGEENTHLIVDQTGEVYVHQDGELQDEPFLDLSDQIIIEEDTRGDFERAPGFDERGLLGMDFHPDFEDNGQFYVRYSSRDPVEGDADDLVGPDGREFPDDWDHVEVLSEFQIADGDDGDDEDEVETDDGNMTDGDGMNATDGNATVGQEDGVATDGPALSADPDSERVLLEMPTPQFNHNGGEVAFGPDGYLYTSIGDGGDGNDTGVGHEEDWYDENEGGNAQNVEANLLGTVIRIDVDEEEDDLEYGIPDDNPLVDTDGYDEIYAYGLRNPWRMSFDDDQLIAADVGQALFEEVDVIENGGNYGWNVREGFHCFDASDATSPPEDCPDSEPDEDPYDGSEFVDPVLEYPHRYQGGSVGISITGGYVYDGDEVDELDGRYVFGDWSAAFAEPQGRLFVATPDGEDDEDDADVGMDDDDDEDGVETDDGMNATDGNETAGTDGDLTGDDGANVTDDNATVGQDDDAGGLNVSEDENETDDGDEEFSLRGMNLQDDGDETDAGGADNQTAGTDDGNLTNGDDTGGADNQTAGTDDGNATQDEGDEEPQAEPQPEEEADIQPPDEHPWEWEEIMVEGGQNQRLNRFIQAFGRDDDGEMYVLASQTGRINEANGEVYRIVPAGEGEEIEQPDAEIPQSDGEDEEEDGATDDADAGNETDAGGADNQTAGTDDDQTDDGGLDENETIEADGNATDGNLTNGDGIGGDEAGS